MKSGERGGQSIGPSRPTQLPGNVSFRARRTSSDQWGGTPSCWGKTFECRCSSWGKAQSCSISRHELPVTVFSAKKNGPMVMLHMTPYQTFTFGRSRACSMTLSGCCDPHIRTLCLFTAPETWIVSSSENMMFVIKLPSLSIRTSM
jgi:hypothetical protein